MTDTDGNPIQGVAVVFQSTTGTLGSESRAVRTDSNGVAGDMLDASIDATVTATTSNNVTDEQTIDVGGEGPTTCDFVFSPQDPRIDETVHFTSISSPGAGNPEIVDFQWDFGDGERGRGQTTDHEYSDSGIFTVVLTIVDELGFSSSCTNEVTVQGEEPICAFSFTPSQPDPNESVRFDASASSDDIGIRTFEWDFGDDTVTIVTDPEIFHAFQNLGPGEQTFVVQLTVTDEDDNSSTCSLPVTINEP